MYLYKYMFMYTDIVYMYMYTLAARMVWKSVGGIFPHPPPPHPHIKTCKYCVVTHVHQRQTIS